MTEKLAPIFVNHDRVSLGGEPKPRVSKIVTSCGKSPEHVQVFRLRNESDPNGVPLAIEATIDRSAESNPVYLRLLEQDQNKKDDTMEGHAAPSGAAPSSSAMPPSSSNPMKPTGTTPAVRPPTNPSRPPAPAPGRTSDERSDRSSSERRSDGENQNQSQKKAGPRTMDASAETND